MSITTKSGGKLYDEILQFSTGWSWTNVEIDNAHEVPETGPTSLTVGKDYEVVKVRGQLVTAAEEYEDTGDSNADTVHTDIGNLRHQLSIRPDFAVKGGDGEVPSGVVYEEHCYSQNPATYTDDTNGNAASFDGTVNSVCDFMLDVEEIPTWSGDLEEGTTLSHHFMWDGIPSGQHQAHATNTLYVKVKD